MNLRAFGVMLGAAMALLACSSATSGTGSRESSPGPSSSGSPISGATTSGPSTDPSNPYTRPELPAAQAIPGVTYKAEPDHTHMSGTLPYDTTPPTGGNHSQYWADCTGTVYPAAIANENAVHMLEHGAVWITYDAQSLPAAQLVQLKAFVAGIDRMALSPYPNLKTAISLQSWDYQLFVDNAAIRGSRRSSRP